MEGSRFCLSLREWLEQLKKDGLGLYEAMDKLDIEAIRNGRDGAAYYQTLCEVYADLKYDSRTDWKYKYGLRLHRATSNLPESLWIQIKEKYNNRCFYCGKEVLLLTKDHVIPTSQGGSDTVENIVPACLSCNRKKGIKPLAKFKEEAGLKLL